MGIEPTTFCVLSRRHNRLDHVDPLWRERKCRARLQGVVGRSGRVGGKGVAQDKKKLRCPPLGQRSTTLLARTAGAPAECPSTDSNREPPDP